MPAPSFVAIEPNNGSFVMGLSCNYPSNTSGQTLWALVKARDNTSTGIPVITTPTGWTAEPVTISGSIFDVTQLFYRAGAGYTGSVSFGFDRLCTANVVILTYDGTRTASPYDGPSTGSTNLNAAHTVNSLTTTVNDSLLVAFFTLNDSGVQYNAAPSGFTTRLNVGGSNSSHGILICDAVKGATGASGSKTATASAAVNGAHLMIALKPFPGPSAPVLTSLTGGEVKTIGTLVNVTWNPATDPDTAQSLLTYAVEYTDNNEATWNVLTAATSAGATSYSWNTTGRTAGSQYKVRVRASDGTNTGQYDTSDSTFTLAAESTPAAPTSLSPNGQAQNQAGTIRFSWDHDAGSETNPQTAYEIVWSYNSDLSSPTTITVTSASEFRDFAGGTFTLNNTVYWKVRATGLSLQSPFSAVASFKAALKPVVNITAPTFASPPTTSRPTTSWTVTTGSQAKYKIRIEQGGGNVYNPGFVASTQTSVTSPYSYSNAVAYTLYISVQSPDGLDSDEDSETFTPIFSPPATPTITVTAQDALGLVQITITNSDTPSYNQLWRYVTSEGIETAILIGDNLGIDATYLDSNIPHNISHTYFARAVDSVNNLIADSATASVTVTLSSLWLHIPTKTSATSNVAGTAVALNNLVSAGMERVHSHSVNKAKPTGRAKPLKFFGQVTSQVHRSNVVRIAEADANKLDNLISILDENSIVCVRDQKSNKLFGRLNVLPVSYNSTYRDVQIEIVAGRYVEGISI